jgi:hypothetical protein
MHSIKEYQLFLPPPIRLHPEQNIAAMLPTFSHPVVSERLKYETVPLSLIPDGYALRMYSDKNCVLNYHGELFS